MKLCKRERVSLYPIHSFPCYITCAPSHCSPSSYRSPFHPPLVTLPFSITLSSTYTITLSVLHHFCFCHSIHTHTNKHIYTHIYTYITHTHITHTVYTHSLTTKRIQMNPQQGESSQGRYSPHGPELFLPLVLGDICLMRRVSLGSS